MNYNEFPSVLSKIMKAEIEPPNFQLMPDIGAAISFLASAPYCPPDAAVRRCKRPDTSIVEWARYFLSYTQRGTFDGSGYILLYNEGKGAIASFQICKHNNELAHDAKPSIGYRPSHCIICGLDTSVDSSD